jgi:23S rRNA pseudouridine1911/1915/1917 synthase
MGSDVRHDPGSDAGELTSPEAGRLDAVLARALPGLSRARIQRLIEAGHVRVNGEPARKSASVVAGDVLTYSVPSTEHEAPASGLDLTVLYEDAVMAAIDKPAGLAVHGAPGDTGPSVAAWWLERLGEHAAGFDVERPGIVHRLDKETSGVLLLAKTPVAQAALSRGFEERATRKTYLAIVEGVPAKPHAVIDAPIDRHPGDRTRMAVTRAGRESRTEYEVAAHDAERALLLVHPETGRTHQIRVHLAAIGHPVAEDGVYGRRAVSGRQLLHAYRIEAPHPEGGRVTVTAPAPEDMAAAIRSIGGEQVASQYSHITPPTREPATD